VHASLQAGLLEGFAWTPSKWTAPRRPFLNVCKYLMDRDYFEDLANGLEFLCTYTRLLSYPREHCTTRLYTCRARACVCVLGVVRPSRSISSNSLI
jgi:hypothetical protein